MGIFDKLKEILDGDDEISLDSADPKFWLNTGNFLLNKMISGSYSKGLPQGRITGIIGPSGSGKSYLLALAVKAALEENFSVLVIDSEKAFDTQYINNVGAVFNDDNYMYTSTNSIDKCAKIVHEIVGEYRKAIKAGTTPPNLLIAIDSIDYLVTKQALEQYEEDGVLANDQGLTAKKHKQMLMNIMQEIGNLPIIVVCTKQTYVDQNAPKNCSPVHQWKVTEAVKFAFSQMFLVTRLMEKNKNTNAYDGINLRVFGYKTRFTKPYQQIELSVPYDKGMDPYEGLLEAAASVGIVTVNKGWYTYKGNKFQENKFDIYKEDILQDMIVLEDATIHVQSAELIEDTGDSMAKAGKEKKKTIKEIIDEKEAKKTE